MHPQTVTKLDISLPSQHAGSNASPVSVTKKIRKGRNQDDAVENAMFHHLNEIWNILQAWLQNSVTPRKHEFTITRERNTESWNSNVVFEPNDILWTFVRVFSFTYATWHWIQEKIFRLQVAVMLLSSNTLCVYVYVCVCTRTGACTCTHECF